ncbi:unnamed protein product, partial [Effrenium voratum]
EFKFAREYIESQADTLLDELLAIVRPAAFFKSTVTRLGRAGFVGPRRTHSASEVNGYCKRFSFN